MSPASDGLANVTHDVATLIPVKAFHDAKERLASVMSDEERAALARRLAEGVIAAAKSTYVAVVCDDDDVASWAAMRQAEVIWAPGRGLNLAVAHGTHHLSNRGFKRIRVVHGDLIDPADLANLPVARGVLLVPDRFDDGTNVIEIPGGVDFGFAYGPGSFTRHLAAARDLGLPVTVLRDTTLGHDVDVPDDLT